MKLKLYFVLVGILKDHNFHAVNGLMFAPDANRLIELIREKYGLSTAIRYIEEVPYEEGTVLFGKSWNVE